MGFLMKIGFASNDWSRSMKDAVGAPVMGGSGHIRLGQFFGPLRSKGIDVALGILAHNSVTGAFGVHAVNGSGDHFDCDVIVMQRYMHEQVISDMKKAQAIGQVVINDVDDWYWGLSQKNAAHSLVDPKNYPTENSEWYRRIIEQSDGVLVSTPFLHEKMSKWNENTILQTNYVSCAQYAEVEAFESDNPLKMVVGWMGSTAHRSGDLEILRPYTRQLEKFARFHHAGDFVQPKVPRFYKEIGASSGNVTTSPFVAPNQVQLGMKFQVGIVQLNNIPFNHAKSYIKGLEYAAAGIPFVASWSPQYEELTQTHMIGDLAGSPADYVDLLEKYFYPEERAKESALLRRRVKKFDVKVGAGLMYKAIRQIHKATWNERR